MPTTGPPLAACSRRVAEGSTGSSQPTWRPSRPPAPWLSTSAQPIIVSATARLPNAVVIDRNVLEWRLDPSSPHRLPMANDPDLRIVLVCSEGYSSSLAAHMLQRLGLTNATDLCGGYEAWAHKPTEGQA